MRTTLNIEEVLLAEAKRAALRRGCSVGVVVEDALRKTLWKQVRGEVDQSPVKFTTFKGSGLRPGVNLNSNAELLDLMEEG